MELNKLIENLNYINVKNYKNADISNISCKSKEPNKNGIYCCFSGTKTDGHNFADEAISNGAECLVVEKFLDLPVCQILVHNARKAMAELCAKFYGIENSKMKFIGITGTNGKTTTTFLIKNYLTKLNKAVGLIGTQGIYFNHIMLPSNLTTPDPTELYKTIYEMEQNGIEYVVMEVSAHAVALNKIDGLNYDIVGLTNITQDHLDFFKTMENYSKAKESLFSLNKAKKAIINIDDSYCKSIYNKCKLPKTSVSLQENADLSLETYETTLKGTTANLRAKEENLNLKTNLVGKYNIANVMMAISVLNQLGFSYNEIIEVVNTTEVNVPGRFNVLKTPSNYSVVVDFAHTPDGVENVINTTRNLTNGNIICVFGCGGDRDSSKRPIMGEIASRYADFCVVTTDNPRTEKPSLIIKEITKNLTEKYKSIEDRKEAIEYALNNANYDDVVLILGKGAENYQEINGVKYPFSDYEVVDNYFKDKENIL